MIVNVTLRYLSGTPVTVKREESVRPGCTAGELSDFVIFAEEKSKAITFSGASIVSVVNGQVVTADHVLKEGDQITIMPVAAAG